jgi:hypothetical protein
VVGLYHAKAFSQERKNILQIYFPVRPAICPTRHIKRFKVLGCRGATLGEIVKAHQLFAVREPPHARSGAVRQAVWYTAGRRMKESVGPRECILPDKVARSPS